MTTDVTVEPHPLLEPRIFRTHFPRPLEELPAPDWLREALSDSAELPFQRDEARRALVRDLLRHGGYKPTGRGKPASEYLVRAAGEGKLSSINLAVDACNATSLHSGLPISVVDLERTVGELSIAIAAPGTRYVFNASGQEIDVSGLVCLFDSEGPCANAVKDAQRTKTHGGTRKTLSVVWGCVGEEEVLEQATDWYRSALERAGATTD